MDLCLCDTLDEHERYRYNDFFKVPHIVPLFCPGVVVTEQSQRMHQIFSGMYAKKIMQATESKTKEPSGRQKVIFREI